MALANRVAIVIAPPITEKTKSSYNWKYKKTRRVGLVDNRPFID